MTEGTDLAKPADDSKLVIHEASAKLQELAASKDDDLKEKILTLAQLTSSHVEGVEGENLIPLIPEIRMRQPTSNAKSIPEDCQPGQLYSTDSDIFGEDFRFIPILRHALRKKWEDEKLDCMSLDGENGTKYGKCAECPYSKYEQGVPVECSSGHSFYVVTPDLDGIYRIDFQKSSARAGRNILRLTKPPALWGKSFVLNTEHQKGNGRNYYTLGTKPTGQKTPPDVQEVCKLLHLYFKAQYDHAKQGLLRFTTEAPTTNVVVTESDDSNIDFSTSM